MVNTPMASDGKYTNQKSKQEKHHLSLLYKAIWKSIGLYGSLIQGYMEVLYRAIWKSIRLYGSL